MASTPLIPSEKEALILLRWSHIGLRTLFVVYSFLLTTWCCLDLVPTFSNDLFHISFWLALEFPYLVMGLIATGYGLESIRGEISIDTARNIKMAAFSMFFAVCIMGKNITHIIFVSLQLAKQSTPIAVQGYWFLVAFLIILICLMFMNIGAIIQFHWYRKHLEMFGQTQAHKKNK